MFFLVASQECVYVAVDDEEDPEEDPEEVLVEDSEEDPDEDDPEEDPEEDPNEALQEDPHEAPEEDPAKESSDRMPPTFLAPKRPRFESDDIARLTWGSKWANDKIEHIAQELRDVNARYAELRSVVQGMESHIVHLTTRVQEEEHRADIAEGRKIMVGENINMTVAELNELINNRIGEAIANYT
ncbi:hypothetical protein E3N88_20087 [Mikania micrantha]|uniref:Uncharacterized protein n=1 Tax=Mikania micrantha TaxID=192012 RepID=A0A5N6NGH6_9ASTR|nr:hypothetical protein E3N88_20087 [Mikania micrantha]